MVKPTIDALTATVPQLGQAPAEFDANTNDFLPQLVPLQDQINLMVDWVEDTATAVDDNAAAALISEAEAENAAFDADVSATEAADSAALAISGGAAAAGADVHVPNAPYTSSDPASAVVSNVDGQTYRCIVSHSDVATDPSADAARWVRISFTGNYDDLNGGPAIASEGQAEAGENNTALMTPLRTAQALAVNLSGFDVFTDEILTSGTWTKRDNAAFVIVELLGAGEGGDAATSSSNIYQGGYGGRGGNYAEALLLASDLPPTVPVLIGAGGRGWRVDNPTVGVGQGGSLDTGAQQALAVGGETEFGDFVSTAGLIEGLTHLNYEVGGLVGERDRYGSSSSLRSTATPSPDTALSGAAGGNGSISNRDAVAGGARIGIRGRATSVGGGATGGAGANGSHGSDSTDFGAGGGGGKDSTGNGVRGGDGGNGGRGGGGGGAGSHGSTSSSGTLYCGYGGDGGDGWARITTLVVRSTQE